MMNRSLAMTITDVEEGDLGLYYCISNVKTHLTVGTGTMLQGKMGTQPKLIQTPVIRTSPTLDITTFLLPLTALFITHATSFCKE